MSRCLGAIALLVLIPLASTALGQEEPGEENAYSTDAGSIDFCSSDDSDDEGEGDDEDDESSCGARRRRHSRNVNVHRDIPSPPPDPETLRRLQQQAWPRGPYDPDALHRAYEEAASRGVPNTIDEVQLHDMLESRGYGDLATMDKYGLWDPMSFLTVEEQHSLDPNAAEALRYLDDMNPSTGVDLSTPPSPGPLPGGFPQPPVDLAPPDAGAPVDGPNVRDLGTPSGL